MLKHLHLLIVLVIVPIAVTFPVTGFFGSFVIFGFDALLVIVGSPVPVPVPVNASVTDPVDTALASPPSRACFLAKLTLIPATNPMNIKMHRIAHIKINVLLRRRFEGRGGGGSGKFER
jgi:hypothetical protein